MSRDGRLLALVVAVLSLTAPLAAACGTIGGDGAGSDLTIMAAIMYLDSAGLHDIEVEVEKTGVPPGDARGRALRMEAIVRLTEWPDELDNRAKKLAQLLGDMATSLAGNDPKMAAQAVTKAHNAEHDFSFYAWEYLQKKAGVSLDDSMGHTSAH